MRQAWPVLALALAGCGRHEAEAWKSKFLSEVNYHYQTQQVKNAEIAARDLEIENLKSHVRILEERLRALEAGAPARVLEGTVTALGPEMDRVELSLGREAGVAVGMEFRITREGRPVGRAVVDRVEAKGAAAKLKEKQQDPKVGDAATSPASR